MRHIAACLSLTALACSAAPSEPAAPTPEPGSFAATIDGAPWAPTSVDAVATPALFTIIAASNLGAPNQLVVSIRLQRSAPGTFAFLPVQSPAAAQATMYYAGVTTPLQVYATSGPGAYGFANITSLTANRAVGTFEFQAPLISGSGPPAKHAVLGGTFDVPLPP
jgi:hypothetical protein